MRFSPGPNLLPGCADSKGPGEPQCYSSRPLVVALLGMNLRPGACCGPSLMPGRAPPLSCPAKAGRQAGAPVGPDPPGPHLGRPTDRPVLSQRRAFDEGEPLQQD